MGEWGGWVDEEHDKTGENRHWLQEIRDYMIDMHIHHTFWCFNENSSDTGGLVYDNFTKWDDVKYEFVKPALWQTEDGKFISLDHTIKLGANGISLSDYYSGNTTPADDDEKTTTTTAVSVSEETTTESESETVYGDANLDGKISISDAVRVLQYIANGEKYSLEKQALVNADVDGNEGVSGKDAAVIQQYDAGIIKELPVSNS